MKYLVTGSAGFIGFHLTRRLLDEGHEVTGFDAMTPYYDVTLKEARNGLLARHSGFTAVLGQLEDADSLNRAADLARPDIIVHLAAQAGVRYSLENPKAYIDSNLIGSWNVLELARRVKPQHLLLASTSSIYGANPKVPFEETDKADEPMSLYAATKKGMEAMAHAYANLHRVPTTVFRFFTVYGPWGRPDMAPWLFTKAILAGEPIKVFNHGKMQRDFTYIDDIVAGVIACLDKPPADNGAAKPGGSVAPHAIYNIGNNRPEELLRFIDIIEQATGKTAIKDFQPMQPGDVPATYADIDAIARDMGYAPTTSLEVGLPKFVEWFRSYHGV